MGDGGGQGWALPTLASVLPNQTENEHHGPRAQAMNEYGPEWVPHK